MEVIMRGGSNIVRARPTFSLDAKYLIYCAGYVVKVASISSGECVHDLKGHSNQVTALLLNPHNQFQVYSTSLDGDIIKWDFRDGVRLHTFNFGSPLMALYSIGDRFVAVQNKSDRNQAVIFSLSKKVDGMCVIIDTVNNREQTLACGCQDDVVASVRGKLLTVYFLSSAKLKSHKLKSSHLTVDGERILNTELTCVCCHPTDQCIATGDKTGAITLWYRFSGHQPTRTVKKWHVLPVQDLYFSASGSYLLSVGHECVLVKWTYNSDLKDFKPRLGAPICALSIAPDGTTYATCHTDNAIQIMTNSFVLKQHFQGLTSAFLRQQDRHMPAGLTVDPRTGALVTNGRPGHLQFYSVQHDKQIYNLDIVGQNYVSSLKLNEPLIVTEVENASFSNNGDWLATIERRDDGVTSPEMRLKFWHYKEKTQMFELNTTVDEPHSMTSHSMKFRPTKAGVSTEPMLVTTSKEGKFKLWALRDDTDIYRQNVCWGCESQGYYRSQSCGACDFSPDGSLLAVAFGATLTLWDPDSNALRHSLTLEDTIRWLHFAGGSCAHYIVCATWKRLYAFNLLSCSVEWSMPWCVTAMAACPHSIYTAIFTSSKKLHIISPRSSTPLFTRSKVSSAEVEDAIFIPNQNEAGSQEDSPPWLQKHSLYFMNSKQELLTLGVEEASQTSTENVVLSQKLPETPFSLLLNQNRKTGATDVSRGLIGQKIAQPGSSFLEEMLLTPAHVLPPVTSLCMAFHETLLLPDKHRKQQQDDDEDEEESADDLSDQSDMDIEHDLTDQVTGSKQTSGVARKEQTDDMLDSSMKRLHTLGISETDDNIYGEMGYDKLTKRTFQWLQNKTGQET